MPDRPGLRGWPATRLQEQATWRELAYTLLFALVLWPLDASVLVVGLGAPLAVLGTPALMGDREVKVLKLWTVTPWPSAAGVALLGFALPAPGLYALGVVAGARAGLARLLLAPEEGELGRRVVELTRSRLRLVDAFEAERRRIERDLHDGARQRLVALTTTLGLARLDAPPGPLADQLAKAHDEAGRALADLRELIHGIHPPSTRGLRPRSGRRRRRRPDLRTRGPPTRPARTASACRRGHRLLRRLRGPRQHRPAQRCHAGRSAGRTRGRAAGAGGAGRRLRGCGRRAGQRADRARGPGVSAGWFTSGVEPGGRFDGSEGGHSVRCGGGSGGRTDGRGGIGGSPRGGAARPAGGGAQPVRAACPRRVRRLANGATADEWSPRQTEDDVQRRVPAVLGYLRS